MPRQRRAVTAEGGRKAVFPSMMKKGSASLRRTPDQCRHRHQPSVSTQVEWLQRGWLWSRYRPARLTELLPGSSPGWCRPGRKGGHTNQMVTSVNNNPGGDERQADQLCAVHRARLYDVLRNGSLPSPPKESARIQALSTVSISNRSRTQMMV